MFNEEGQRLLKKLKKEAKEAIFIIEGKKDKKALESLDVDADFFLLCRQNKSLQESAEEISQKYKRAILMLDHDKQGKKMEKMITHYLQRNGVKVNRRFGKKLLRIANSNTVEGI
jgi:5S rRNA maturation endonuclease (ribonuclease M5)